MWLISLCALGVIVQSSLTDSFSSLVLAIITAVTAFLIEFLIYFRTDRSFMIYDGSAIVSALILVLLLPNRISPMYAATGMIFALIIVKYSFGGLGSNWLNPALAAWLFIRSSWPLSFPPTALDNIPATNLSRSISSFLNSYLFPLINTTVPDSFLNLFMVPLDGTTIADRGVFALIISTLILTAAQVGHSWIPALYLGVYTVLVATVGDGNLFHALFSGGTLVAAFLLCTDPATGAKSRGGIVATTVLASVLGFIFRYVIGEPFGMYMAVIVVNVFTPFIRNLEERLLYS
jgi:electron transport complex protein RnfD